MVDQAGEDQEITELVGQDLVDREQAALQKAVEAAFARADRTNVRETTREIWRLLQQLNDRALRARYEGALDALPEMVKHGSEPE